MKRCLLLVAAAVLFSGCRAQGNQIIIVSETPSPTATGSASVSRNTPATGTSMDPKLSGDITGAPSTDDIQQAEGFELSAILTSDAIEYTLPMDRCFAVCLKEDAASGNRWLLASDDGDFQMLRETFLNGYRVFIIKPVLEGGTYILFELASQDGRSLETVSYHIVLG